MKQYVPALFILMCFSTPKFSKSQPAKDTTRNYSAFRRSLSFSGLFQPRYTVSLTPDVDVNGVHQLPGAKMVNNSFSLRRARFSVKAQVNDHWDANLLVNFAEFSSTLVAGRVLENAYVRYSANRYFHAMAGQFRPFIGIEDVVPVDFIKSLDFSNGYYAFGRNGWQSFQLGFALYGDINKKGTIRYFAGVHNGNGRNQQTDNDNGKHFYVRGEADVLKGLTLGANGGLGTTDNKHGNIFGVDARSAISLGHRWSLNLNAVYKNGTNFYTYDTTKGSKPVLKDCRIKNFYVFPNLRYATGLPRLRSVECSGRYEFLNEDDKRSGNHRQTFTPMLGLEFADQYFACLQLGATIDLYKQSIPQTAQYTHHTLVAQLQIRF